MTIQERHIQVAGFNEAVITYPTNFNSIFSKSKIFDAISNLPNSVLHRHAKRILKTLLFKHGRTTGLLTVSNDTLVKLADCGITTVKKTLTYLYKQFGRFITSTIYKTGKFKAKLRRQINICWKRLLIYLRGLVRKYTGEREWFYFPKERDLFLSLGKKSNSRKNSVENHEEFQEGFQGGMYNPPDVQKSESFQVGDLAYLKLRSSTLVHKNNKIKKRESDKKTSLDAPCGASHDDSLQEDSLKNKTSCRTKGKKKKDKGAEQEKTKLPGSMPQQPAPQRLTLQRETSPEVHKLRLRRRGEQRAPLTNYTALVRAKKSKLREITGPTDFSDSHILTSSVVDPKSETPIPVVKRDPDKPFPSRPIERNPEPVYNVDPNNPRDVRNMFIRNVLRRDDLPKILETQGINEETLRVRMRENHDYNPQKVDHKIPWDTECHPKYALLDEVARSWKFSEAAAKWLGTDCQYFSQRTKNIMAKARKMADEIMADYNDWCAAQYRIKKRDIMCTHFCSKWARQNYDKYMEEGWNEPEFVGCKLTESYREKSRKDYVPYSQWVRKQWEDTCEQLKSFVENQNWSVS